MKNIYIQVSPFERLQIAMEHCEHMLSKENLASGVKEEWLLRMANVCKELKAMKDAQDAAKDISTTEGRNEAMMAFISSGGHAHHAA